MVINAGGGVKTFLGLILRGRSPRCTVSAMTTQNIGARIAQRQKLLGLNDTVVAAAIGKTAETIKNWKVGKHRPAAEDIPPLSVVLKCSPMWLLGLRATPGKALQG